MGDIVQVRGKNPKGKLVTLDKSQPAQMSLFQTFLSDGDKYSNTIELYDAIPKYTVSRKLKRLRENGKYLPILERTFAYKERNTGEMVTYYVTIEPGRLKDQDDVEKEYYPTEREEFVEEALRKIAAADRLSGIYLDDHAGVQFTLKQLKKELAGQGHDMSLEKIVEALNICNKTHLSVKREDGANVLSAPIFPVAILPDRAAWLAAPRATCCYVQFNPLVTHSINHLTYRQFDYVTFMAYKSQLARWLHKRLSHNYINADYTNTYSLLASTMIRDSGTLNAHQFRDNISHIDAAVKELKEKRVLARYEKVIRHDRRGKKIEDVKYMLSPHYDFVAEMKAANKRQRVIGEEAQRSGHANTRLFKGGHSNSRKVVTQARG